MDEAVKTLISFHYENGVIKIRRNQLFYPLLIKFEFFNEMKKILGFDLNRSTYRMRYGVISGDYPLTCTVYTQVLWCATPAL